MKLITFERNGIIDFGVISARDGGIVRLGARTGLPSLASYLAEGLPAAADAASESGELSLTQVRLLPPVPHPEHMFGIGLNTYSHLVEAGKPRSDAPTNPMVFVRFGSSVVGHGGELEMPSDVTTFDYEGEIALIIGKPGRNIPVESALDHVAGVSCFNDGSVREYQRHTSQVTPGKNFDASGAFGPWIVTVDEVGPLDDLVLTTEVNGVQKQRLTTDDLIFGFAELVSYLSHSVTLQPGDVIATGSPAGVAVFAGPYLSPGDEVAISVEGVGTLKNTVVCVKSTPRQG
ncbi:fumarylacetoacetate hydrolase family protein [Prescottella subtropica]|uniref:fumarylacetoacetate hydrolase family protein n=1 Tax=Prescottella subtropica TaxID=2545757 RepID=UPI0010F6D2F8|nr:fumarylacetoacetate hydrolase family protein [Prescottella subtropica]